jgi:NYN domain
MIASLPAQTRIRRFTPLAPPAPAIAAVTGPLDALVNGNVLVLADDENLRYSARDLGYRLSMRRLGQSLQRQACRCALHAYFSREPGDEHRCRYLLERGWIPHPRDIETVQTHRGTKRLANSDNDLLFAAGNLASRGTADVVVLASGDGTLVCDLARNLRQLPQARTILTLSLAGSTSYRLDAARNSHIDGNIEIGLDCLHRHPC